MPYASLREEPLVGLLVAMEFLLVALVSRSAQTALEAQFVRKVPLLW